MGELTDAEIARRMRALAAYGKQRADGRVTSLTAEEAAAAVGVTLTTWARMVGRKGDEITRANENQQARLAAYVGMPPAFFDVDFDRLPEITSESAALPLDRYLVEAARAIVDIDARRRAALEAAREAEEAAPRQRPPHDEDAA